VSNTDSINIISSFILSETILLKFPEEDTSVRTRLKFENLRGTYENPVIITIDTPTQLT